MIKGVRMDTIIIILALAHEIVIVAENRKDLESLTKTFIEETEEMGVRINDNKKIQ